MGEKVVVTGATSSIGVFLIEWLLHQNKEVYAIIRPKSKNRYRLPQNNPLLQLVELDSANVFEHKEEIPLSKADVFYHLAWEGTRAPLRDDKDLQESNYQNAMAAAMTAIALECKAFVGCGSQAEYGVTNGAVYETNQCKPVSEYGKFKLMTYQKMSELFSTHQIRFIWPRIFSVYGRYDYDGTLVMSAIRKMKNNQSLDLTLCTHKWDYINVKDIGIALGMLGFNEKAEGIYNLASGLTKPLKDYIETIKEVTDSDSKLNFGAIAYGKEGPVNLEPDISRLRETLGWQPEIQFEEGIRELLLYVD